MRQPEPVLDSATVVGDAATSDAAGRSTRPATARRASAAASRCCSRSAREPAIASGGLGVTRIAEMLGREKSQVSRTLKTLAEYGLVDRDPDTLAYRLGWRIFALANLAGERRLLDYARPLLARLVTAFEERAYLSVLQGSDTLTILSESVADAPSRRSAGSVATTPAYCTSVGQALLFDHGPRGARAPVRGRRRSQPLGPEHRHGTWTSWSTGSSRRARAATPSPTRRWSRVSSPSPRRCATPRPDRRGAQRVGPEVPARRRGSTRSARRSSRPPRICRAALAAAAPTRRR